MGKKKSWIYPLYVNEKTIECINKTSEIIFVESIGDMLNLHENGFHNVIVTFGLDMSTKVICASLSLNVEKIVISLNNDTSSSRNRGLEASIKNYLRLLNYYDPHKILICLQLQKDFGDMSQEEFKKWSNKLQSTDPNNQQKFILQKINNIHKNIPKTLLKNVKIISSE